MRIFWFYTDGIFSDLSKNVGPGGFEQYDPLREDLLVPNARAVFCWFLFFVEIKKRFDLAQSLRNTY